MLKPFLISIGIYLCVLGGECLILEKAVMAREAPAVEQPAGLFSPQPVASPKSEIAPSEWAPWSFLSVGAVVILYSLSINRGE